MKKTFILFIAFSFFAACNNDKGPKGQNSSENKSKDDYRSNEKNTEDSKSDSRDEEVKTANWTRSDENKFMIDCESTAKENVGVARANEYCDCMLKEIKKSYSSYAEANLKLSGITQEDVKKLAAPCNPE